MKRILVLIVAISAIAVFAGHVYGQQNSGATPYLDSKHSYRVKIGKVANTQNWSIVNGAGTIEEDLSDGTPGNFAEIVSATSDNSFEVITLTFKGTAAFDATTGFSPGKWFLRFEETSIDDGTCVSAREFEINIVANTFWLEVAHNETDRLTSTDGIQVFNSQHNVVNTYDNQTTNQFGTSVKYTVTMHKNSAFEPTYWQFDANFALPVENLTATVTTTNGGTIETTTVTNGEKYTLKVTPNESHKDLETVVVQLEVVYKHNVLSDANRALVVGSGVAVRVPAVAVPMPPNAYVDDNITTYPIGPDAGNRTQALTILAIPSTRDITFDNSINTNEDATSSKNPLQNSTHYYKVEMGAIGNTGSWSLVNTSDNSEIDLTLYSGSINDTKNTSHALATINYGTLPVGTYTLYFSETDAARGTITRRSYPISIQPPFQIELADRGNDCADVSGELKTELVATTTNVTYTIRLKDNDPSAGESYYSKAWSFVFTVSGFNADLEVSAFAVSPATATLGAGTTSRTVNVPAGTHSVNVTVTYLGFYSSEHVITATASNATGVFNEKAANVSDTHTIYAMPQAGTLAGVD